MATRSMEKNLKELMKLCRQILDENSQEKTQKNEIMPEPDESYK